MSDQPKLGAFKLYFEDIPLFEKYHRRLVRQSKKENK